MVPPAVLGDWFSSARSTQYSVVPSLNAMRVSLTRPCLLIALLTIIQPALQKSIEPHIIGEAEQEFTRTRREVVNGVPAVEQESATSGQSSVHSGDHQDLAPTPCPEGQAFCESTGDYPKEHIKDIQKKEPKTSHLHNEEVAIISDNPGNASASFRVCPTETKIVYPTKAQNMEGTLYFIVNDDEFKQGIKVETCKSTGECNIPGNLTYGYTSRCVQTYVTRALVVLNKDSTAAGFATKLFEFPSGCSCEISSGINPVNTTKS